MWAGDCRGADVLAAQLAALLRMHDATLRQYCWG
jgi:hypothetical protein